MVPHQICTQDISDRCCINPSGCYIFFVFFVQWCKNEVFWEQLRTAIYDSGVNVVSITLNQSIALLGGHDADFRSDDSFDWHILLAKNISFTIVKLKKETQIYSFTHYLKTTLKVFKHNSIVSMSYNKYITSWHFHKTLVKPQNCSCGTFLSCSC